MAVHACLQKHINNAAPYPIIRILADSGSPRNIVRKSKADTRYILRQLIWIFPDNVIKPASIFIINLNRIGRTDSIFR